MDKLFAENSDIFACPACCGDLKFGDTEIICISCDRKFNANNGIPELYWSHEDSSGVTNKVRDFYERTPFPDYDDIDSRASLVDKAKEGLFASTLNKQIPIGVTVLEVGCGTGQLTNFLGMTAGRRIFGSDLCMNSLKLGQKFKDNNGIGSSAFLQMNLFRPAFRPDSFDLVICNGVLHHTGNPAGGFESIAKLVKPGGFIVVGLYNQYGRIMNDVRRLFFRLTGNAFKNIDYHIKKDKLTGGRLSAWFSDQYQHPHESKHTFGEVARWFNNGGFSFVNSIPKTKLFMPFSEDEKMFKKTPLGGAVGRFLVQLAMVFKSRNEGGFFTMIGKKDAGKSAIPDAPQPGKRIINIMKNIGAVFIGFLLAFAVMEITVRIFFPQERSMFIADPYIRTIHVANADTIRGCQDGNVCLSHVRTNAQGFSGAEDFVVDKSPETFRVATVGDSMNEGFQVDYDKTYSFLLQKELNDAKKGNQNFQVYNFGVSGIGTQIEYLIYDHYIKPYKSDLVVLQYYLGNDVADDLLLDQNPDSAVNYQVKWGKLRAFLSNVLQSPRFIVRRLEQLKAFKELLYRGGLASRRNDYYNAGYPFIYDIYNKRTDTVFKKAVENNCKTVNKFYNAVRADGTKMLVLVIPDKNTLFKDDWASVLKQYPDMAKEKWDLAQPMNRLLTCLNENKIPYLNLYDKFKPLVAAGKPRMYYNVDVHINPTGDALIAGYLKDEVLKLIK